MNKMRVNSTLNLNISSSLKPLTLKSNISFMLQVFNNNEKDKILWLYLVMFWRKMYVMPACVFSQHIPFNYRYTLPDIGYVLQLLMSGGYRSSYCRKQFRQKYQALKHIVSFLFTLCLLVRVAKFSFRTWWIVIKMIISVREVI